EDYADCISALLVHENITNCTMLGHSMGGYITLAFAEKYPDLLDGFGLIHSTAFADSEEKKKNREKSIALIEAYGPFPFLRNMIPNLFGTKFKAASPERVEALVLSAQNFSKETIVQYTIAMMNRPDRTAVLKGNPLPVLFVIGTEDIAAPMADVMQQTQLPNKSFVHVLQDTGHIGMWEATAEMNSILPDFINRY
ncbi:MAG: alpha/beta hydrolase, partial [Bacteroidota bacterium]